MDRGGPYGSYAHFNIFIVVAMVTEKLKTKEN